MIRGNASLDDVVEAIGTPIEIEDEDADIDTFGGLVFGSLAEIPDDGEMFDTTIGNLSISVKKVLDHKLVEAVVTVHMPEKDDDEDGDDE